MTFRKDGGGCHRDLVALSCAKAHGQQFMLDTVQWTGSGAAEESSSTHYSELRKIFRTLGPEPILTFTEAHVTL